MISSQDVQVIAGGVASEGKDIKTNEALTHTLINRMKQPEKYGTSLVEMVLNHFPNIVNNLSEQKDDDMEMKKAYVAVGNTLRGNIKDETNGATHFAPKGSKLVGNFEKTHSTDTHNFYKESLADVNKQKPKRKTLR